MIPKIRRGKKLPGLVAYLLGPGEHNEHTNRHIVAGSPTVMREMWLENFDGPGADEAARETALAVAHEIEIPRRLYNTQVRMKAKVAVGVGGRELGMDVIEPARRGEEGTYKDAPVWHCVLALMPGEELSDDRWQQIADTFMDRMGFTGTPDGKRAQARWAAVRHGLSGADGEGQDHIHIAASLVREDGSKVSTYDYGPGKAKGDWKRADEICGELEHEFGLKVLASRKEGGGLSENSRAEIERSKRLGTAETERERLRRMVRAVAVAAESETAFVEGLRERGISIRPRYKPGGTEEVTGYSVRLRRDGGEVGPWLGGGKLAGDLSLTALREQQWDDSPEARAAALAAWKNHTRSGKAGRGGGDGVEAWKQAAAETERWRERLAGVPHGDRAQWAWLAGQAAGVFAAWSETLEGDQPGAFAAAADSLTRSAQLQRRTDRWRPPPGTHPTALGDVARLLLNNSTQARPRSHARSTREGDPAAEVAAVLLALLLLLLLLAVAIALAVAQAHRSRGELSRALAVEQSARQFDPVRAQWEAELAERRHQWDRDAADVFAAAAGRAARRTINPETATDADTSRGSKTPQSPERRSAVVAAASGPLTPPSARRRTRRAYYSDMTDDQKSMLRINAVAATAHTDLDLNPRGWTDEVLDEELEHRRTEVRLLVEDLAARRTEGGPHTRQARIDNATLTEQAEKIPAAQKAQQAAAKATETEFELTKKHQDQQQDLDELPGRRILAKKKLQAEIAQTIGQLEEAVPKATAARAAADVAAEDTGVPVHEWDGILFQARDEQKRRRLAQAVGKDQEDIDNDTSYLQHHLQRDLEIVEKEHARRAKLTPEQRATEARTPSKTKTTGPKRSVGTERPAASRRPYKGPERGPSSGQGIGM